MIDRKLNDILLQHLPEAPANKSLSTEQSLVDLGIDSLRLVELIVNLEDSFGIVIPDEEMLAENFSTVGSVSNLVNRVLSAGAESQTG